MLLVDNSILDAVKDPCIFFEFSLTLFQNFEIVVCFSTTVFTECIYTQLCYLANIKAVQLPVYFSVWLLNICSSLILAREEV